MWITGPPRRRGGRIDLQECADTPPPSVSNRCMYMTPSHRGSAERGRSVSRPLPKRSRFHLLHRGGKRAPPLSTEPPPLGGIGNGISPHPSARTALFLEASARCGSTSTKQKVYKVRWTVVSFSASLGFRYHRWAGRVGSETTTSSSHSSSSIFCQHTGPHPRSILLELVSTRPHRRQWTLPFPKIDST